jgi:RAB protein geranylgeranyltransferase component A
MVCCREKRCAITEDRWADWDTAGMNLSQTTMKQVYDKYGLEQTTRDFIGHSMALYATDDYIESKGMAKDCVERIRLYVNSMARYGKSPYIYPLYGLGELPQGFARLSAIYGGTYMLNTNIDEIKYENGKVSGIRATMKERGEEGDGMKFETKCSKILADPSYFPDKAKVVGHLIKAICILNHPIDKTDNSDSVQLILPQSQVGRKHDIYIAMVSGAHNVCPKGYYIAIVSTIAETDANHHLEIQPGLDRLGKIEEKFMGPPIPLYEPLESGASDNIFLSKSYDASSHFETTTGMYTLIIYSLPVTNNIYRRRQGHLLKGRRPRAQGRGPKGWPEPCRRRVEPRTYTLSLAVESSIDSTVVTIVRALASSRKSRPRSYCVTATIDLAP